ncbi:MAG: nitroreductase family deazaflavin-dependent oxidoreductase [Anaerolineae bacterium]|nr:MAG: nitroreductase family deazaflavin-dependent oxidoreductase [Anaerolineae bacterium]
MQPRPYMRPIKWLVALRPISWLLARLLPPVDRFFLRRSNNRWSVAAWLTGLPIVTLTCTGAKSGRREVVPLVGLLDGERVVLYASNFGGPRHPAWYHNLVAHPKAELAWGGHTGQYRMREALGEERARYWARAVALYRGYDYYARRTAPRVIPVLVMEPLNPES